MDIAIQRKAQSFRLPVDLIERLKKLAKMQNRSLNNFVECVLLDAVYEQTNDETLAAMKEAREGRLRDVPALDLTSIESMEKSMDQ